MNGLERSAKKETGYMIITVLLYAIGAASIPYTWLSDLLGGAKEWEWLFGFLVKSTASIMCIYLIVKFGFKNLFSVKGPLILSTPTAPAMFMMTMRRMSSRLIRSSLFSLFPMTTMLLLTVSTIRQTELLLSLLSSITSAQVILTLLSLPRM